ncbi:MAG: hypothetical protein V3V08_01410 [Nannocystaceae bacterium]
MLRRTPSWTIALTLCAYVGCGREPAPPPAPAPACEALLAAAERAAACDLGLGELARNLGADQLDERVCQETARQLLSQDAPRARVSGTHRPAVVAPRLDPVQLAALRELPLPGHLSLRPDLPAVPGLPATSAKLGSRAMAQSGATLQAHAHAGRHILSIDYAGTRQTYCVRLAECQELALTLHGASLAPHPHVDPGDCSTPNVPARPAAAAATASLTRR